MKYLKNKNFIITILTIFLIGILFLILFLISLINVSKTGITPGFQQIMVMPNSPFENDRGFNQHTIDGSVKYGKDFDEKIGKIVPSEIDNLNEYQKSISYSYDNGSKIIATSGFNTLDSVLGSSDFSTGTRATNGVLYKDKYKDDWYLVIDDANYDGRIARNAISFRFQSEQAGFIAGIAASVYSTSVENYKVSTYGGQQFPTVFDFMSGYEQAINWFNYQILGYDLDHQKTNSNAFLFDSSFSNNYVHLLNQFGETPNYSEQVSQSDTNDWFSGSFNVGDGRTITSHLLNQNTSVIFPVNGGQSIDTLNLLEQQNQSSEDKLYKMIGVDVDASNQYPNAVDSILGSATKNIDYSINLGLWYIDKFILDYNQDDNFLNDYEITNFSLEEDYYNNISTSKTDGGWKENNPKFTSNDFSTLDNNEIDNYLQDPASDVFYVEDVPSSYYYTEQESLKYGSEFIGTYQNGGIGFVTSNPLLNSYQILLDEYDSNLDFDFNDFIEFSLSSQPTDIDGEILIENASNTFSSEFVSPVTSDFYLDYPWIPNWDVYHK